MKKKKFIPLIVLLLIFVYSLGLAFSLFITAYPNADRAINYTKESVLQHTVQYKEGTLKDAVISTYSKVLVYSPDGKLIEEFDYDSRIPYYCEDITQDYLNSGKSDLYCKTMLLKERNRGSFDEKYDLVVYCACRVSPDGEVVVRIFDLVTNVFYIKSTFIAYNAICLCILACLIILESMKSVHNKSRQKYIDNITHELKTPIASIKALTNALIDLDMDEDERSEYYGLILYEASQQERMVQNILELSRIQARTEKVVKSDISASEFLDHICVHYSNMCDDVGIRWTGPENTDSLPRLHTNAAYIERLMDVLIGNALRYTNEGGSIELSFTENSKDITVCVSDSGCGIAPDDMKHIFDRFYRGGNSYLKGGNGLGLAIAKEITDSLSERIWVESEKDKGSRFFFTIQKSKAK